MTGASGGRLPRAPRLWPARMELAAAQELLGAEHPLARAENRVCWLGRQAATLGALLAVGALATVAGAPRLPAALLAGTMVQACLLVCLSAAVAVRRERALELIAEDRGALPLDCVRRRRARLMRTRSVHELAEAIQALRREARCPYRRYPRRRPLYVPGVIRAADTELATTVRVLSARPNASTVARVERLLVAHPPRCPERTPGACGRSSRAFISKPTTRMTAPARLQRRTARRALTRRPEVGGYALTLLPQASWTVSLCGSGTSTPALDSVGLITSSHAC